MKLEGPACFLNTGSIWQHYEGAPYDPVNLYAATKQAFVDVLRYYEAVAGMRSMTLELTDSYGPDDPRPKLVQLLLEAERTGATLPMTAGEQVIDLVHVDDIARAFEVAARLLVSTATRMPAYSIDSDRPLQVRELVTIFERVRRTKLSIEWGKLDYRPRETFTPMRLNPRLPGWAPQIALEVGLAGLNGSDTTA